MISHHIHLSRSPSAVRVAQPVEPFVRETGPAAMEMPVGGESAAAEYDRSSVASADLLARNQQALQEAVENIFEAVNQLEQRRQQALGELRELAVEIACAVATHVVDEALVREQFPLQQLVDRALEHLDVKQPSEVTFKLNPEDCQAIERAWKELDSAGHTRPPVAWRADRTLPRGSCEATVGEQGVLVDIHDQLHQIRHELLGTLDNAQTERRDAAQGDRHVQRYPNRRDTA